jgi:UTP--glucose-1-phosphate uridylyltransferase
MCAQRVRPVTKAVIPAAGRGTRFLPVTKTVPKEMLPIVSTPALELVVAEAAGHELRDVLLVVGPGKDRMIEYFEPDADLELAVGHKPALLASIRRPPTLARIHRAEQDVPRGLGDAISTAESFANDEPFAVLLPDDVIDDRDDLLGPMLAAHAEYGGVVLALSDVGPEAISAYGAIKPAPSFDGASDVVPIADLVEKPRPEEAPSTLAVIGRYVLPPEIFPAIRKTEPGALGEVQLTDAIGALLRDGTPVHGVVFRGRRYDTGVPLSYLQTVVQFAARDAEIGAQFRQWLRDYVSNGTAHDGSS